MKSSIEVTTAVNLKLDKKEALWLKGIVQNPINCDYEKEHEEDQAIRKAFWQALIDVEY